MHWILWRFLQYSFKTFLQIKVKLYVLQKIFTLLNICNFLVLASSGRLHVYKSHTLLSLAWHTVLGVYASEGLTSLITSCTIPGFNIFGIHPITLSFDRIFYDRTTQGSCYGKYLVFKLQLCACLAFLNTKKSCGMHLSLQVDWYFYNLPSLVKFQYTKWSISLIFFDMFCTYRQCSNCSEFPNSWWTWIVCVVLKLDTCQPIYGLVHLPT